jgi:O-antigen/teichoic acid export membrane protein
VPFGVGLALFAPYVVDFGLGDRWRPAIGLIQVFGLIAAVNHVAFNWGAYYMARSDTWPLAVVKVVSAAIFLACAIPLLITHGLNGLAIGLAVSTAAALAVRGLYTRRMFPGFRLLRQMARGFAPAVPAAGAVLLVRLVSGGHEGPPRAVAELLLYIALTAAATALLERPLLRELAGYVRDRRLGSAPAGAPRPAPDSAV